MSRVRNGALAATCVSVLAIALSGCGGAGGVDPSAPGAAPATTPVVAAAGPSAAAPTGPLNQGDLVAPGAKTPKPVVAALKSGKPVVIAFLYGGAADEAVVGRAVSKVRRSVTGRGVRYFVYDVSRNSGFGDLPTRLGVTETPCVAVIGRDARVVNIWTGLIDAEMLGESVASAKDTGPN